MLIIDIIYKDSKIILIILPYKFQYKKYTIGIIISLVFYEVAYKENNDMIFNNYDFEYHVNLFSKNPCQRCHLNHAW